MKTVLAFLFLMIGLMVFPPGPVKATSIDHRITFVSDVGHVAPVAMIQETGGIEYRQVSVITYYNQLDAAMPEMILMGDKHVVLKLPAIKWSNVDRLCQHTYAVNQRPPNIISAKATHNITISPIQIRADSQV